MLPMPGRPHRPPSRTSNRSTRPETPAGSVQARERSLSFVDLTLQDIQVAILAEDPNWNFQTDFWQAVLLGAAAPEFRCMQNRTLGFWAKSFSRWQDLRKQQELDQRCTVAQLEKVFLGFARPRCLELGKLFGGLRTLSQVTEKTSVWLPELFTAGVLMSEIISSTNKLHFVLGLVDADGKKSLSEKEFGSFVAHFIRGLCGAFGLNSVPDGPRTRDKGASGASGADHRGHCAGLLLERRHSSAWVNSDEEHRLRYAQAPKEEAINIIAQRLYSRISRGAARRVLKLHSSLRTDAERAAVLAAIKARQTRPATGGNPKSEQRLPFSVVVDWCFRGVKDPLALPYALAIERFCPRESSADDNPENFEAEEGVFHLRSAAEVDAREAEAAQHMPTRSDIIAARFVYNFAVARNYFLLSPEQLEVQMAQAGHGEVDFAVRLQAACCQAEEIRSKSRKPSFLRFLRLLYAWAMPKHLRMFDRWCQQYDELQAKKQQMNADLGALKAFLASVEAWKSTPILPQQEKDKILQDFERMDLEKRGMVEIGELKQQFAFEGLDGLLQEYDSSGDGTIDKSEFLTMMCPPGYRIETGDDFVGQVLGQLLQAYVEEETRSVTQEEDRFEKGSARLRANSVSLYAALPMVPEEKWESWNALFTHLDRDEDGCISAEDLRGFPGIFHSGAVRDQLLGVLDPKAHFGVSREFFLETLLKTHRLRKP
ncbi:unnamed protein product [Effrenium voratum]|uniref:EF-hand domain-containing protein n=1 Tax=Effrenium voratum TaxID=2562239 RepID=A0AA36NCM3_9DINO|nr:unnamed protein product [Effrenium voratum]CAJ1426253.1 unnamed protein product [Effrenium voratum]